MGCICFIVRVQPASFVAIDPGNSGAYVIRRPGLPVGSVMEIGAYHEPQDVVKLMRFLHQLNLTPGGLVAVIERVWASPVMGVSAAFAFGENYGAWIMALRVTDIPIYTVTPQQWQKVVAPEIEGQGADRKRALKAAAARIFPDLKITLATCDALLIAEYATRQLAAGKPLGERI